MKVAEYKLIMAKGVLHVIGKARFPPWSLPSHVGRRKLKAGLYKSH